MDLSFPISTVVAGLLGLWLVVLSVNVVRLRRSSEVSLGAGDDRRLMRAVRAHGNLTEYAPLFTILLVLAEAQGGSAVLLGALGALFVAGRVGHGIALGFTEKSAIGRIGGMAATFAALILIAVYALVLALS